MNVIQSFCESTLSSVSVFYSLELRRVVTQCPKRIKRTAEFGEKDNVNVLITVAHF